MFVNLINDALWLFGLVITIYLAISLASFSMDDPAWSRSVPKSNDVANLGGLFGSYLSDVGYYLFGLSFWWWIAASCVFLYKNFRPMKKQENHKPYNHGVAALALFLLLVCSPIIEHFLFDNALSEFLPVGAGGLVGVIGRLRPGLAVGQIRQPVDYAGDVAVVHFPAGSGVMVGSHDQIQQPYGRPVWQPDEKTVSIPK